MKTIQKDERLLQSQQRMMAANNQMIRERQAEMLEAHKKREAEKKTAADKAKK